MVSNIQSPMSSRNTQTLRHSKKDQNSWTSKLISAIFSFKRRNPRGFTKYGNIFLQRFTSACRSIRSIFDTKQSFKAKKHLHELIKNGENADDEKKCLPVLAREGSPENHFYTGEYFLRVLSSNFPIHGQFSSKESILIYCYYNPRMSTCLLEINLTVVKENVTLFKVLIYVFRPGQDPCLPANENRKHKLAEDAFLTVHIRWKNRPRRSWPESRLPNAAASSICCRIRWAYPFSTRFVFV